MGKGKSPALRGEGTVIVPGHAGTLKRAAVGNGQGLRTGKVSPFGQGCGRGGGRALPGRPCPALPPRARRGKQIHDANIVATMLVYGERRLLTFNADDFRRYGDRLELVVG